MKEILYRWLTSYLGWAGFILYGGGKGQPAAPDYRAAAEQQGQSARENTAYQTAANRPNINTPWGQQTWDSTAGTDAATGDPVTNWTQNITLSPEQQAAQEAQSRITSGRSGLAEGLMGQVGQATASPFNWEGMPKVGDLSTLQQGAYEKMAAMLQPGRQQQEETMHNRLLASGMAEGNRGWDRAGMGLQNQWTQEDKSMMSQALAEGRADLGTMQGQRTNAIAEEAQRRGMSLNELNALLTGQQVTMPAGMQGAPGSTAGVAAATPYMAAAQGQGQQNLQGGTNWGSALGGIAQVAGAAAPLMAMSDRRLKRNIRHLVDGWYEYEYLWDTTKRVGVMAQELMATRPELVHITPSGYLAVNYGGL